MEIKFVKSGEEELTVIAGSVKRIENLMHGVSVKSMKITFSTNCVEDVDKAIEVLESIKHSHVLEKYV